ncbi:homoserine dehydrogenase [Flaviflexus salsibiostraticola]|uniref:Homoserine dehydrogenase n=1 Tax=Flaviflexus salsibiostraticola TaxID=1282737 RepID=A0A3S8Z9A6_9ACTO|nr:homoserine dehydrogenase [Flaviflexus salsibiostraticola]AZN29916.1 homoserine dehydrogenase [Flaviflexus salsibiostraticola]
MSVKIALLGCGTVGTAVATMLQEQNGDFAERAGDTLELIGIAVRDLDAPRDPAIDRSLLTDDVDGLMAGADIVIELIGGIEPARTHVLNAIRGGATVVTGNKALLAAHGPEIYEAAAEADVDVYYEAAVAGAVPVVYGLRESLAGDRVESVLGIVNGTTNFILDEMETAGLSFDEALKKAQDLGFAEADPTADVDGHDAAAKIAILASLAFHTRVSIEDVPTTGIRAITAEDIAAAKRDGYAIKLLAIARRRDAGIELSVEPTLVPHDHPLAAVRGSFNSVVIEASGAGRLMFYGRGAGGAPTASAVLSDVVAGASHRVHGGRAPRELTYADLPILAREDSIASYRIDFAVEDRTGVLTRLSGAFADSGVSIAAVRQMQEEGGARLTVTTHEARTADVDAALAAITSADYVKEVLQVMRVEGS